MAAYTIYTRRSRGLLAVCPYVPKFLAVIALRQARLAPIDLNLDDDMAQGSPFKYLLRLVSPWQCYHE